MGFNIIFVVEVVSYIKYGYNIGFSGFILVGILKVVIFEVVKIVEEEYVKGNFF